MEPMHTLTCVAVVATRHELPDVVSNLVTVFVLPWTLDKAAEHGCSRAFDLYPFLPCTQKALVGAVANRHFYLVQRIINEKGVGQLSDDSMRDIARRAESADLPGVLEWTKRRFREQWNWDIVDADSLAESAVIDSHFQFVRWIVVHRGLASIERTLGFAMAYDRQTIVSHLLRICSGAERLDALHTAMIVCAKNNLVDSILRLFGTEMALRGARYDIKAILDVAVDRESIRVLDAVLLFCRDKYRAEFGPNVVRAFTEATSRQRWMAATWILDNYVTEIRLCLQRATYSAWNNTIGRSFVQAVGWRQFHIVIRLLRGFNITQDNLEHAMHIAANNGLKRGGTIQENLASLLIAKCNSAGVSAQLLPAVENGHVELAKMIWHKCSRDDDADLKTGKALIDSAGARNPALVRFFMEKLLNLFVKRCDKAYYFGLVLKKAIETGHTEIASMLLERCAASNVTTGLLEAAIQSKMYELAKKIAIDPVLVDVESVVLFIEVVPVTPRVPAIEVFTPTFKFFAMPTPPAVTIDPVGGDVESVTLLIVTLPVTPSVPPTATLTPTFKFLAMPAPPSVKDIIFS